MNFEVIKWVVVLLSIPISIFAYLNARKSRKISERALRVSERSERRINIDLINTVPALDLLDVIKVGAKYRVKILLTNLRSTPFRINCLKLYKKSEKIGRAHV